MFSVSRAGLLADSNPLVVANAVAALIEIDEISPEPVFVMNRQTLSKLITGLEDCPEWGQCFLLNSISKYNPKDAKEAKIIIDKVCSRSFSPVLLLILPLIFVLSCF
jgi:vesicle coat complex subunit